MKIFLAGGTGALGRQALPRLVRAGHAVTVITRSATKAAWVSETGATPAAIDVWDADQLGRAVAGHDAVVNLATAIPPPNRALLPRAWRENDRIRRDLSCMLADAALAAGATHYVQESLAFIYRAGGDAWLDEDSPVDAVDQTTSALEAEAQCARFADAGGRAVVLRFGLFIDPPTSGAGLVEAARRGRIPFFGAPGDFISLLHTADAGSAVVAALAAPTGVYNVVETDPRTRGQHVQTLGTLLGRPVRLMPRIAGMLPRVRALARSQRISNRRFRDATGWEPEWGGDARGWESVARSAAPRQMSFPTDGAPFNSRRGPESESKFDRG
jgi:nucleoside-diphosphate-sugar epimerase